MQNERGRIHEHKAPFCKQLSAQAFSILLCQSMWETRSESAHGHCLGSLFSSAQLTAFAVLLLAVIKQRCITAGTPFWIEGELHVFVVRPHAPNREFRAVTVRYEYMYRYTPTFKASHWCLGQSLTSCKDFQVTH